MNLAREGPPLEALLRRVAETPEEFLAPPRVQGTGEVHVAAVVGDLLRRLGIAPDPGVLGEFEGSTTRKDGAWLSMALVFSWLLADDFFRELRPTAGNVLEALRIDARALSSLVSARAVVADPLRREEVARLALGRLGCRPAGETIPQAEDRLSALSSSERARVLKASRDAEERARSVREALLKERARRSADKWTRE